MRYREEWRRKRGRGVRTDASTRAANAMSLVRPHLRSSTGSHLIHKLNLIPRLLRHVHHHRPILLVFVFLLVLVRVRVPSP